MKIIPKIKKPEKVWRTSMKKLFAALMTVLFLGSTTGLVFAQGTAPAATSVTKTSHKTHKKVKKVKKSSTAPAAESTTPTSK